jgi:hypothetical protein
VLFCILYGLSLLVADANAEQDCLGDQLPSANICAGYVSYFHLDNGVPFVVPAFLETAYLSDECYLESVKVLCAYQYPECGSEVGNSDTQSRQNRRTADACSLARRTCSDVHSAEIVVSLCTGQAGPREYQESNLLSGNASSSYHLVYKERCPYGFAVPDNPSDSRNIFGPNSSTCALNCQ